MNYESDMLKYINMARQFPAYYISLIDKQLETFLNDKEMPIGEDIIYETNEGKQAWKQARQYLQQQIPLTPFQLHEGLHQSSKDHATDLAKNGIFGHTGSDKSTFSERILRYCKKGQGAMAEIIGADFLIKDRNNAELTILGLIIDDGVPDRGHRRTIFNSQYRYIGCKSQVQNDKLISVFNLTENKLQLRSQISSLSEEEKNSFSASSGFRQSKNQKVELQFSKTEPNYKNVAKDMVLKTSQQRSVFDELSKNTVSKPPSKSNKSQISKSQMKKGKRITQKKENMRTYFEDNCKITEKTIQVYYSDGTMQENIEKHTVYN